MKLDRTDNPTKTGKYSLILNRKVAASPEHIKREILDALKILEEHGVVDHGNNDNTEFFVLRLRDAHAGSALLQYSTHAERYGDKEFAADVGRLAARSFNHPKRQIPT